MLDAIDYSFYLNFFIGMLALINPIGILPIFIGLTSHQSPLDRKRTGLGAALAVGVILILVLLVGESILTVFGITIPSFRIAGGLLILLMALSMLQGRIGEVKNTREETQESATKESLAVVPLAMPVMAGPGAMSTVILYAHQAHSWPQVLGLGLAIVLLCLLIWVSLRTAPLIARMLGTTGINIVTRIMGLIIVAIGIEFIAAGAKELFPVLMN